MWAHLFASSDYIQTTCWLLRRWWKPACLYDVAASFSNFQTLPIQGFSGLAGTERWQYEMSVRHTSTLLIIGRSKGNSDLLEDWKTVLCPLEWFLSLAMFLHAGSRPKLDTPDASKDDWYVVMIVPARSHHHFVTYPPLLNWVSGSGTMCYLGRDKSLTCWTWLCVYSSDLKPHDAI